MATKASRTYELPVVTDEAGLAFSVSFSPDGRGLASMSQDRTLKVWGVDDVT